MCVGANRHPEVEHEPEVERVVIAAPAATEASREIERGILMKERSVGEKSRRRGEKIRGLGHVGRGIYDMTVEYLHGHEAVRLSRKRNHHYRSGNKLDRDLEEERPG